MNETENRCSRGCCNVSHQEDNRLEFDMTHCEQAENFARMIANFQDRAVNFTVEQDGHRVWIIIHETSRQ